MSSLHPFTFVDGGGDCEFNLRKQKSSLMNPPWTKNSSRSRFCSRKRGEGSKVKLLALMNF